MVTNYKNFNFAKSIFLTPLDFFETILFIYQNKFSFFCYNRQNKMFSNFKMRLSIKKAGNNFV